MKYTEGELERLKQAAIDGLAAGLSAADIAERIGVARSTMSRLIRTHGLRPIRMRRDITDEQRDAVRSGYADGISVIEIACRIGTTRNSVIGIARRLGLSHPCARSGKRRGPVRRREILPPWRMPEPVAGGCRWIDGDVKAKTATWCDAPQRHGSSYCSEHHARCWRPVPKKV